MSEAQHLEFLKSFPHLTDWLNLNGYSLIYSHKDEYDQIHTMWSDRSNAPIENGTTDATEWLIVTYCEHCKVIDVYKRIALCALGDDKQMAEELSGHFIADSVIDGRANDPDDIGLL